MELASLEVEDVRGRVESAVDAYVEERKKRTEARRDAAARERALQRVPWWKLWLANPKNAGALIITESLLWFGTMLGVLLAFASWMGKRTQRRRQLAQMAWDDRVAALEVDPDLKEGMERLTFTTSAFKEHKIAEVIALHDNRRRVAEQRASEEAAEEAAREAAQVKAAAAREATAATRRRIEEELRAREIEGAAEAVWDLHALRLAVANAEVPSSGVLDLVADVARHRGIYLDMSPEHVEVMYGLPDHSPRKVMKTKTKQTYTYYDYSGRILQKFEFEDDKLVEYQIA